MGVCVRVWSVTDHESSEEFSFIVRWHIERQGLADDAGSLRVHLWGLCVALPLLVSALLLHA